MNKMDESLHKLMSLVTPNLLNNIIYTDDHGYVLYDKYFITRASDIYNVTRNSDGSVLTFSKLKHAASWAILDKYNKIFQARRLVELDSSLSSLQTEILIHKKLKRQGTLESKEINRDKYLVNLDKQKRIQGELDKYIMLAKLCQDKGYQYELTGTSGK
jgi:hypothetical protein